VATNMYRRPSAASKTICGRLHIGERLDSFKERQARERRILSSSFVKFSPGDPRPLAYPHSDGSFGPALVAQRDAVKPHRVALKFDGADEALADFLGDADRRGIVRMDEAD
jgi:hypothetical protein